MTSVCLCSHCWYTLVGREKVEGAEGWGGEGWVWKDSHGGFTPIIHTCKRTHTPGTCTHFLHVQYMYMCKHVVSNTLCKCAHKNNSSNHTRYVDMYINCIHRVTEQAYMYTSSPGVLRFEESQVDRFFNKMFTVDFLTHNN